MARHLSVGTIIEKNRIASENVFLILIDANIKDTDGNPVTTLRFVKNSENIVYSGNTYQAANFDIDITAENNTEPSIKLTAQDQTRTLAQYIEAYDGLVGCDITMTVVNSGDLSAVPEIQETFKIISSGISEYVVSFDLGTDSAVNRRFPPYRQFKDRCPWKYKGPRCGYTGALPKCDYTLNGSNGCVAHDNTIHFGGMPGINDNQS